MPATWGGGERPLAVRDAVAAVAFPLRAAEDVVFGEPGECRPAQGVAGLVDGAPA